MQPSELRDALRRLGLSQVQLARDLRVSDRAVRYWLAGTYRVPAPAIRVIRRSLERGYYDTPVPSPRLEARLG